MHARFGRPEGSGAVSTHPEISVVLATYNHEPFIREAIASVLGQQTSRPFELIISEDCSTDGTREIVQEAAGRDARVRLLLSPVNLRSNLVVARGIQSARGRYLCLLDGDDRWIVSDKLERQATLLDAEPRAAACFGNALLVRGTEHEPTTERWTPSTQPKATTLAAIWRGNPFATSAGMMRREALAELGHWYDDFFPVTDWPLYILCAAQGDLLFVDEPVAAYRLHEGGMFSALPDREKLDRISDFFSKMDQATAGRWRDHARRGQANYLLEWADSYAASGRRGLAGACLWKAVRTGAVLHEPKLFSAWARAAVRFLSGRRA